MGPTINVGGNGGSESRVIYGLQPPRTLDKRKWKTSIILSASPYPGDLHRFLSHCIFCSFFPNIALKQIKQRLLVIASIREHINIKALNLKKKKQILFSKDT